MGLPVNAQVLQFSVIMYLCFRLKYKLGRQLPYKGILIQRDMGRVKGTSRHRWSKKTTELPNKHSVKSISTC